jgi:RNA polymerase sigma-70 factor (ECF subfamily)
LDREKHIGEDVLIELLQKGDQNGYAYLLDHYSAALGGIIFTVLNNQPDTEDVLQEVFIRVHRSISQYDPSRSRLFTWMARIARNAAIDWLRKEKAKVVSLHNQTGEDAVSTTAVPYDPDATDLRNWISRLEKPEQEVLVLTYLNGHTQDEASQLLQLPLGTVKSRVRSALVKLRKMMADKQ